MGRSYYYFAASLPMLDWEGKLPMTSGDFVSDAQRLLAEDDYALIRQLLEDDDRTIETDNTVAYSWIQFNRNFRNELAWFRAQRAKKDPLKFIHGTKENAPSLRELIHQASKMSNLLEAEKILDRKRWQFLDDLAGGHYYDFECLIVYGLKLKILKKHREYDSPMGKDAFDEIKMMELPESCILPRS